MRVERLVASAVLGESVPIRAVLPDDGAGTPAVLYLLHGLGEERWGRSGVADLLAASGLAVVMPALGASFGTDEVHGKPYWTYLTREAPAVVERELGLAPPRSRTFVAGHSMGGYAALKWALRHPERFAAAASLSGSLDIADPDRYRRRPELMARLFGGRPVRDTPDDLLWLAARADPATSTALYLGCGEQDAHLTENRRLADAAERAGLPLTVAWGPGGHDWAYWERTYAEVLAWLAVIAGREA